jgi:hypothetical protein
MRRPARGSNSDAISMATHELAAVQEIACGIPANSPTSPGLEHRKIHEMKIGDRILWITPDKSRWRPTLPGGRVVPAH